MRPVPLAALSVLAVSLVLTACGGRGSSSSPAIGHSRPWWETHPTPAHPGRFIRALGGETYVRVGKYWMHLHCQGAGSPTVVLDAGGGETWSTWEQVQSGVKTFTRSCSYDRLTSSDGLGPATRTGKTIVEQLHTMLEHANIVGPYVLVGHSDGGQYARIYAQQYRSEVVGMVLVETAHPDAPKRMLAVLPPKRPGENTTIAEGRAILSATYDDRERLDLVAMMNQARASGSLDGLPLVIITQGSGQVFLPGPGEPFIPPRIDRRLWQIWLATQREMAKLSSDSVHVMADESTHAIPQEQPEVVVEAIREVVTVARGKAHHLPACGHSFTALHAHCIH